MGPMGPAGFRRRGRRRGLIVGAAVGAAAAKRSNAQQAPDQPAEAGDMQDYEAELTKLQELKEKGLITEDEYDAKKKQVLGL